MTSVPEGSKEDLESNQQMVQAMVQLAQQVMQPLQPAQPQIYMPPPAATRRPSFADAPLARKQPALEAPLAAAEGDGDVAIGFLTIAAF